MKKTLQTLIVITSITLAVTPAFAQTEIKKPIQKSWVTQIGDFFGSFIPSETVKVEKEDGKAPLAAAATTPAKIQTQTEYKTEEQPTVVITSMPSSHIQGESGHAVPKENPVYLIPRKIGHEVAAVKQDNVYSTYTLESDHAVPNETPPTETSVHLTPMKIENEVAIVKQDNTYTRAVQPDPIVIKQDQTQYTSSSKWPAISTLAEPYLGGIQAEVDVPVKVTEIPSRTEDLAEITQASDKDDCHDEEMRPVVEKKFVKDLVFNLEVDLKADTSLPESGDLDIILRKNGNVTLEAACTSGYKVYKRDGTVIEGAGTMRIADGYLSCVLKDVGPFDMSHFDSVEVAPSGSLQLTVKSYRFSFVFNPGEPFAETPCLLDSESGETAASECAAVEASTLLF